MATVTKSQHTVICYLHTASLLEERARRDLELAPNSSLKATTFISWAARLRPTLSRSTWRQYRAALRCWLGRQRGDNVREAIALLDLASTKTCRSNTRSTSAQKARKLTIDDFKAIRDHLLQGKSKWARQTVEWLAAASLTGLRPAEWFGTTLNKDVDGRTMLHVPNAKATNARAHGPARTLDISAIEPAMLASIRRQLAYVAKFKSRDQFHKAYIACSKVLYRATRRLWPDRTLYPCLYSARHQFAADSKAAGLSRSEVAALMGHASDQTASLHYGRRVSGRTGFCIRPLPEEVARVFKKTANRTEYLARKHQTAATSPSPTPTR